MQEKLKFRKPLVFLVFILALVDVLKLADSELISFSLDLISISRGNRHAKKLAGSFITDNLQSVYANLFVMDCQQRV
jgi:hypothetical protein